MAFYNRDIRWWMIGLMSVVAGMIVSMTTLINPSAGKIAGVITGVAVLGMFVLSCLQFVGMVCYIKTANPCL